MLNKRFTIERKTGAGELSQRSTDFFEEVGEIYISYSPNENEYTLKNGGFSKTEKEYKFTSQQANIDLKIGDKLLSKEINFTVAEVYKYDDNIKKISGVVQKID